MAVLPNSLQSKPLQPKRPYGTLVNLYAISIASTFVFYQNLRRMAKLRSHAMDERQILDMSLERENSAYSFYDGLLESTDVGFLKELLEELRENEGRHVQMIKQRISRLNMGKG